MKRLPTLIAVPLAATAMFAASLALTCGLMWLLKNVEHDTHSGHADHFPLTLVRPVGHRA